METTQVLEKIKNELPHGAQREIAKRANVAISTVNLVLKGKMKNIKVLSVAADYLEESRKEESKVFERINALVA